MTLSDLIAIILGIGIAHYFWKSVVYPIWLSPLSHVPSAHPLARLTSWWMTYIRWSKCEIATIHAAHQRHGPVIVLGPQELSVNCVKGGIQTVYSGGFEKGNWYDIFANYEGVRNMFSMPWAKAHAARKRMVSNIYSKSSIQNSPSMEAVTKRLLFERLLPRFQAYAKEAAVFDVYSELNAATMDFVTGYQFGLKSSSDFIRDVEFRENFLDWYTSRTGLNFWPQECPKLTTFLEKLKIQLVPDHVFIANKNIEQWCLALCDSATEYLRKARINGADELPAEELCNYPTVFSQLLSAVGKSKEYESVEAEERRLAIASEMLDHLAAGFDTSGITLCYAFHELSKHPDVQEKLRAELESLSMRMTNLDGLSTERDICSAKQLDSLPYLDAVLQETLRLHSAIPGPEPRVTPPGGCSLGPEGEYGSIPGGIRISAQPHSLHRNPEVFEKPDMWQPGRWMDASEDKMKEMRRWFWAFGSGGRMCVGSNLALYQMKFIIAAIYANFRTFIVDDKGIEQMDLYTAPPNGGKLMIRIEMVS